MQSPRRTGQLYHATLQNGKHGILKKLFTDTARPRIKNFMTAVTAKMSQTAGKRAPRRCAPTKTAHIPLPKAARRGGYAGCGFAASGRAWSQAAPRYLAGLLLRATVDLNTVVSMSTSLFKVLCLRFPFDSGYNVVCPRSIRPYHIYRITRVCPSRTAIL